ncbi:MAG: ATP synthase F0 subunit A [Blastopirellula sp.]|nr:MAG: ATP synthase F0 subunit A [Blastopirellula sp.]
MADAILHIKDSYYFDVPKWLWSADYKSHEDFPEVWVRLDSDFQKWEAEQLYLGLEQVNAKQTGKMPTSEEFQDGYSSWTHLPGNHGKPAKRYLKHLNDEAHNAEGASLTSHWTDLWSKQQADIKVRDYKPVDADHWNAVTIEGYNRALDGKILIPQLPGAQLRNLYQPESGLCISRFMIIELFVALVISVCFIGLARQIQGGQVARGRFWNLLDVFVGFLRKQVIEPAIGHGAEKFVPLLWTMFFFVLGCNLLGMIPWVGAPTSSFSVTLALAFATFIIGLGAGALKFGPVGVWLNLIPGMDLPLPIAVIVKPMLFVIEVMGLMIKHTVLGIRLLANMVAGHLVLLGIMGIAYDPALFEEPSWYFIFPAVIIGCIAFSCLELFVAFLQAYIFVSLSSLFIGSSTHHH